MRKLVAGPWIGEFGWELMSWQGHLRKLAKDYNEIVVCGPENHEALYADFAHVYIPHRLNGTRDCWRCNLGHNDISLVNSHLNKLGGDLLQPDRRVPVTAQTFIRFGDAAKGAGYDVLLHARHPIGKRPEHAWPAEHCQQVADRLVSKGLRVAAVGTQAHAPGSATDLRNLPMAELMNVMAASKLMLGPSSGPIHLASLCGLTHVCWSDQKVQAAVASTNRQRYEKIWNPLSTRAIVIDKFGWNPPVDAVVEAAEGALTNAG
jgi:hypothetical protein